jgi:hypothetical protein
MSRNRLVEVLACLTCIYEVPNLSLGLFTSYFERLLPNFPHSQANIIIFIFLVLISVRGCVNPRA